MKIVNLDPGLSAPKDSDCISIGRLAGGKFSLTGSVLSGATSVAMVDGPAYDTHELAEAEGLAWAAGNGVTLLYVSTSGA